MTIRDCIEKDLPAVQQIYAQYVLHSLATFEEDPPSVAELFDRRQTILRHGLPFLTAEADGLIIGYAYATPYRPRPAYRYTVENSVYVAQEFHTKGVGTALLSAVIGRCEASGFRQMLAVIGDSGNAGSIALHTRLGFKHVGNLDAVGFKFGRWVDTVLMKKALGTCMLP